MAVTVPYDADAEQALVGALLVGFNDAVGHAAKVLVPSDFYVPRNSAAFAAICSLWEQGHRIDALVVADEAKRMGSPLELADLHAMAANATGSWRRTSETIKREAVRRNLHTALSAGLASLATADPAVVVEGVRDGLANLGAVVSGPTRDMYTAAELIERTRLAPPAWVIPGILRHGWRAVIVAFEGKGKSVLLTQMACASANGVHPFTHTPIERQRTLLIDLENPADVVARRLQSMRGAEGDVHVWHRPQGIDLRGRTGQAEFEANITAANPDLVCLGPLYKSYTRTAKESDEQAAVEVQAFLDGVQARHGFALLIEHHAPHADGYSGRKPRPYGSSLWLRWPEFGIGLEDDEKRVGSLKLGRFRGDRVVAKWPSRIDRSVGAWPWAGYYAQGMAEF